MLPSKPSALRRFMMIGVVLVSILFGQQSLDKVVELINAIAVTNLPAA